MNNKKREISPATVNKILSITIAILLWLFVIGGENPVKDRTIYNVPVTLKNLETLADENLAIAGGTSYTVDVKLKGQRTVVDPLTAADIEVEADLFGYGIGQNFINVTAVIPDNTELVEIRSPKIQVNIEELVAVSKPVHINFTNVPTGKEVGGLSVQPLEVEVSGAQSLVGSVARAFGTVNVSEYSPDAVNTTQAELQPLNDGEALVNNVRMSSRSADISYVVMDVKEVPLVTEKNYPPVDGMAVEEIRVPQIVKIRGLAGDLEAVSQIKTEALSTEDLIPDENGQAEVTLTPILPEGVELSKANPVLTAAVTLKPVASETLEYSGNDIEIRNLPENAGAMIEEGMYTVSVYAAEENLDGFEKADVTLYVDASELVEPDAPETDGGAGTAEETPVSLTIHAEYTKAFDYVTVLPNAVKVRLRRNEE